MSINNAIKDTLIGLSNTITEAREDEIIFGFGQIYAWIDAANRLPLKCGKYMTFEKTIYGADIKNLLDLDESSGDYFVRYYDGEKFVLPYDGVPKAVRGLDVTRSVVLWRHIERIPSLKEIAEGL